MTLLAAFAGWHRCGHPSGAPSRAIPHDNNLKKENDMKYFAIAALALTPVAAFADPNIDMSKGIANGSLGVDLQSQAVSGAMIEGYTPGTVTATTGARNWSTAHGGFGQEVFLETDNAGAGVGGFGDAGIGGTTFAATGGHAFADTSGAAKKKGISTVAGTFGSADVSVDFDTDWTLKSDDYN